MMFKYLLKIMCGYIFDDIDVKKRIFLLTYQKLGEFWLVKEWNTGLNNLGWFGQVDLHSPL